MSASLLMAAAAWCGSSGESSYEDLWTRQLTVETGLGELETDLRHVLNDL